MQSIIIYGVVIFLPFPLQIKSYENMIAELRVSTQGSGQPRYPRTFRYYEDLCRLPSDVEIDGALDGERSELTGDGSHVEAKAENVDEIAEEDVLASMHCPQCDLNFHRDVDFLEHVTNCID